MNNLSNTAKKLDKVFEIAHIVFGALAIASAVGVALIAVAYIFKLDPEMIGTGYASFDIGFLELTVAEAFAPSKWLVLGQAAITLLVACRFLLSSRRGVGYIREILKPMTENQPFDSTVSENLKKLARLSIELGILWNIIILAEQIIAFFVYDLPGLLISEKIASVATNYTLDISFLICSGILLLLSYIFRYGTELQQLSDETL